MNPGNRGTIETASGQIVRPIISRGSIPVSSTASTSASGNGRVLPVVYLKMQQREQIVPVVSRSGNLISTIGPKISTAPSGNVTTAIAGNQSGFLTIQGPIRSVSHTSANPPSQPHIITLPKVPNTALTLSNQQMLALQSGQIVSGPNQSLPKVSNTALTLSNQQMLALQSGQIVSGSNQSLPKVPNTALTLSNQQMLTLQSGQIVSGSNQSLPKVSNTALTLSNQQMLALQSGQIVSGSNQSGSVQQPQYVTIQAPIVSKTQQSSGGLNSGQVQPQYVTIRTPVINQSSGGVGPGSQSQFVTIQAPVVPSGVQQTSSTYIPVSSVGQTSGSMKSPVTYQILKSSVEKQIVYPVSMSNMMPSTQSKMVFTPVTMIPKMSVVPAGTTSITVQASSDVAGNSAPISGLKLGSNSPYSSKVINSSAVSILQGKSLPATSFRKEGVILPSVDGSPATVSQPKVLLPISMSNASSTNSATQGFINLTIANGHIQPSILKNLPDNSRVEGETKVKKDLTTLSDVKVDRKIESVTTLPESLENSISVEATNIGDLLHSKVGSSKQKLGNSEVIDINSILKSGSATKTESGACQSNTISIDCAEAESESSDKVPTDVTNEPSSSKGEKSLTSDDLPEPSSPINLFCEEGDITPSPPNEQPPAKYTITMSDNPDEDIQIKRVNSDTGETDANEDGNQTHSVHKPLLKKSSPKLLSKNSSSSKGQSLLRNPAAIVSTPSKTSKPVSNKVTVKSILKPQANKKHDIKIEESEIGNDGMGDTGGDSKDSLDGSNSPLTPSSFEDFDAIAALEWKNGIGLLPGSNLKFRMNEFGLMEILSDEEYKSIKVDKDANSDSEGLLIDEGSNSSIDTKPNFDNLKDKKESVSDDVYCCETCNVYGLASEFLNERFCTQACSAAFTVKKAFQYRREQDLRALRLRRKKRRLEQQRQAREKAEQEMKEEDGKGGNLLMSKLLEKFKSTASESMSDGDDSVEDPVFMDSHIPSSLSPSLNTLDKSSIPGPESDSLNEDSAKRGLKQKSKANFTWGKYLEMVKAKAAPSKLFKDAFPYLKNGFKVGMKLEGIDPEHPACFCVLTVAEVKGYRIRLHFDGYPDNYDFWVNADSQEIFQAGWCEKNMRRLTPPKGHANFNWTSYLKLCKGTAAPKFLFSKTSANPVCPNGFRVGMKLEAVDRKNSSLVCVASIADIIDGRCLIHFDSWDDMYDYWADPSSPYIHPVGWCATNGVSLTPPNQYKDPSVFSWDKYLKETKTVAAPARAFKQRQPSGFRRGMRLEAVDKRAPHLIRVATVDNVLGHTIRIRFDGWPDEYSYWVDDDSPDIHPPGWCADTKHPLEPPLSEEDMKTVSKCGVLGCKGQGHVKGPKYTCHSTAQNCPYAPANLRKDSHLPDRLTCNNDNSALDEWPVVPFDRSDNRKQSERPPRWKRLLQDSDDREPKRMKLLDEDDDNGDKPSLIASMQQKLQSELERSVVDPGYQIETGPGRPTFWAKHSKPLHESPMIRNAVNPHLWTAEEVVEFLSSVPCLEEYCKMFKDQEVDGESLLMLTQNELVSKMNLKLGHAIRLYNSIVILRQKCL